MTTMTITNPLDLRIKQVLEEKSLLKHEFYREWTEGTLPKAKIREYTRQYFHFETAFPRFLSAIHTRTDSLRIRQLLLANLWDEEYGDRNHATLWLDFAAALGVKEKDVRGAKLNPETRALIDHFSSEAHEAPIGEALATLFAYEGQVPAVAFEKIRGLHQHYGLVPDQFQFFSVHIVSDIAHSNAELEALSESCMDDDAVVQATSDACDKLLAFLDGCYAYSGAN
ncbi:hypothetical protein AYO38_08990 [bacterium SCGC AG-212-C10]|nr:hypothetical protein AYO38_08990 [bacterium SCGC AG-212-C10]